MYCDGSHLDREIDVDVHCNCHQVGSKFWSVICSEHGLDKEGRWGGQSLTQAERLGVYWREQDNNIMGDHENIMQVLILCFYISLIQEIASIVKRKSCINIDFDLI